MSDAEHPSHDARILLLERAVTNQHADIEGLLHTAERILKLMGAPHARQVEPKASDYQTSLLMDAVRSLSARVAVLEKLRLAPVPPAPVVKPLPPDQKLTQDITDLRESIWKLNRRIDSLGDRATPVELGHEYGSAEGRTSVKSMIEERIERDYNGEPEPVDLYDRIAKDRWWR